MTAIGWRKRGGSKPITFIKRKHMSIEAMKLALEALERSVATCFDQYAHNEVMSRPEHFVNQAITALRQAIEQAQKQEPVAWKDKTYGNLHHQDFGNSIPLYISPPQRQPLTDEQILELWRNAQDRVSFARAIEAKLKQKNGCAEEKNT
jgi:hypothetical protein